MRKVSKCCMMFYLPLSLLIVFLFISGIFQRQESDQVFNWHKQKLKSIFSDDPSYLSTQEPKSTRKDVKPTAKQKSAVAAKPKSPYKPKVTKYNPKKDLLLPGGTFEEILNRTIVSEGSRKLPEEGSIYCFLFTHPKHFNRVSTVVETWLPRCDRGEFYVSKPIEKGTVYWNESRIGPSTASLIPYAVTFGEILDDHAHLLSKGLWALKYAYNRYPKFDWYFKADGDSYVIMENLRKYLKGFDPNEPLYIGYRLNFTKKYMEHGYNAGGSGYALSRAAMKLFDEKLYDNRTLCPPSEHEDAGVGICFANIGIYPIDTRTTTGQQRFNQYRFEDIIGQLVKQKWIYDKYDPKLKGAAAISSDLISIHHVKPAEMLAYDALLYRVSTD